MAGSVRVVGGAGGERYKKRQLLELSYAEEETPPIWQSHLELEHLQLVQLQCYVPIYVGSY